MKENKYFWIDEERNFMHQYDWKRPITDESFFLDKKLEWMDKNNIDHEVIITLSQLYCNGYSQEDSRLIMRFQNEFHAKVQREHGDKFTCGFVVPAAYIDDAINEMEYAVNELNLRVLCLPTHFLNENGKWTSIADERCFPIFEKANELGLAVEIHPYDGQKMVDLEDQYWRFHLVWMCAQTADTYHLFTLLGIDQKFPNMRTCFAHANMLGQANQGRRVQGFKGRPDLFKGTVNPEESNIHKNIFFDSLVHDPYTFQLLKSRAGIDQIVAGLDDPYPLGEMESVADSYPGKVFDDAKELGFLTDVEIDQMWTTNVERWLGFKVG